MTISYLYVCVLEQGDMQKGGFQRMVCGEKFDKRVFFDYIYIIPDPLTVGNHVDLIHYFVLIFRQNQ